MVDARHLPRFTIAVLLLLQCAATADTAKRDEWVDPHAWKHRSAPSLRASQSDEAASTSASTCATCPQPSSPAATERAYSDFVYRKLVNFLINDKYMKLDPDSGQLLRTLKIRLTREQYAQLRDASSDLRDIDGVLQDVWQQSRPSTAEGVHDMLWSWGDALRLFWRHDLLANRWLVNGVQALFAIAVFMVARRHRISIGVMVCTALAFAVYRYLDADCHRKLEIERIADLMQGNSNARNPCENASETSWWAFLVGGSRREECKRFLETRYEKQCDFKALYDGFLQTFVFGAMEGFFGAMFGIVDNVRGKYGYMAMMVAMVLIYANLGVFINAIFKYVIGVFMQRIVGGPAAPPPSIQQHSQPPAVDHLSGENIQRLLNITESNTKLMASMAKSFRAQCTISGVEAIEAKLPVAQAPTVLQLKASDDGATPVTSSSKTASTKSVEPSAPQMESSEDGGSTSSAQTVSSTLNGIIRDDLVDSAEDLLGDTASEYDIVILEDFHSEVSSE